MSVVLPTLDEREHITDCLESLLRQDYDAVVEILVVDGGSTDGTRPAAAWEPRSRCSASARRLRCDERRGSRRRAAT